MRNLVGLFIGLLLFIFTAVGVSAKEYEVKQGDTLWNIAKQHNMTVDEIVELNDLKSTTIKPKQTLKLMTVYKVEKGDTLYSISKKYNVKVSQLKEWNGLKSDTLKIGQKLKIKESKEKANNEVKSVATDGANKKVEGKTLTVTATAYTAKCSGCSGITATGINLNKDPNAKVIAVDPNVIPLGSKVHVEGYGEAIAGDTGGAIKGNKIDIHVPTQSEATNWGVRSVNITILD